jgi:hypothetical protein
MSKKSRPSKFDDTRAIEELRVEIYPRMAVWEYGEVLARVGELMIEVTDPILTVLHKAMRGPVTFKDLSDAKDRLEDFQSWARSMAELDGKTEGGAEGETEIQK